MYSWLMKQKIWQWFLIYLVVIIPFVLLFDVHGDTADHYLWSRYLEWSYEHPPMIAWVMRAFSFWSPYPIMTLQVVCVILFALTLYIGYAGCKDIYNEKVARIWLLMMFTAPFWTAGAIFFNVNILMLLCIVSGIWTISRLANTKNAYYLLLLGVLAGLGGLSKYIYILFCIAVAVLFVVDKDMRWVFKTWQLYMIPVIALVIFTPMVIADWKNDFYSFAFNFSKGVSTDKILTLEKVAPFVGGAVLIFSPVFSILALIYLFQKKLSIWSNPAEKFLFLLAVIFLGFFTLKSFRSGTMAPNWVDTGFLALFMILAKYFEYKEVVFEKFFKWAVSILAVLFVLFLLVYQGRLHSVLFPAETKVAWTDKEIYNYQFYSYVGKREQARDIEDKILKANNNKLPKFLVMEHYMLQGDVVAYMKNEIIPFNMGRPKRNVWIDINEVKKSDFVLVCLARLCDIDKERVKEMFDRTAPEYVGRTETKYHDTIIKTFDIYIYRVSDE